MAAPEHLKALLQQVAEAASRDKALVLGLIIREDSVERFCPEQLTDAKFYEVLTGAAEPFRKDLTDA